MSKQVKEMQMRFLGDTFQGVRDMVLMSSAGLNAVSENQIRLDLRKKGIRLLLVKNTLARRVLNDMGMELQGVWEGPTLVGWGSSSIASLSKELDQAFKGNKNVQFKGAVADGSQVTFRQALEMPTREEAIGRVIGLALAPARNLVARLLGPASQLVGQIKSLGDEKPGDEKPGDEGGSPEPAA